MTPCERRAFLGKTVLAGAGVLASAAGTASAQNAGTKRRSPASSELLRVGFLACDPSGHLAIWGPLINPPEGWTRRTGMVISHCWDIDKADEERFAKTYGCERVKNYTDMIGKVDAIIIPSFDTAYGVNKHLVKPYLEAGIPVFINRPFAFSMADAEEIVQLSKKTGTPIMCGSAFEYCKETRIIQRAVERCAPLYGAAVSSDSSDFPSHGIHPLYWVHRIFGGDIARVSYFTREWRKVHGSVQIEYNPRKQGEAPFYVNIVYIQNTPTQTWGTMNISGGNGADIITIRTETETQEMFNFFFLPSVLAMQKFFESGEMPEPTDSILGKTRLFLSAWKSHVDHNGAPVVPSELPRDWTGPHMYFTRPDRYPAGYFG